jgi:TRAP-type C4-dicarboxylate transport system substrate-binding protein
MKKTLFLIVFGLVGLMWVMAGGVHAQKVIEWRINTPHGPGRLEWDLEKEWADALTKESGGRLKVTLYPLNALGFKDADMLRVVPGGVIEGSMYYDGYVSRDDPILGLTSPDSVVSENEAAINYVYLATDMARNRLSKKWKLRLSIVFANTSCDAGLIGKAPYNTLESLQGKKIRGWSQSIVNVLKRVGIAGQMMAQSDLYLALKTGVLDGAIHLPNAYLTASLYEVAPYYAKIYQGMFIQGLMTSEAAFNALPPDLQEMMKRVEANLDKKWRSEAYTACSKTDGVTYKLLKQKGATILPPFSEKDQKILTEAGIEVWRERAKQLGPEGIEYQKTLEALLKQATGGK